MLTRLRRWLHRRGHHRLCYEVRIIDHYDYSPEWLELKDGTKVDVTVFGGKPIYRIEHG